MPSVREMGLLAEAVYYPDRVSISGWSRTVIHLAAGKLNGFQAATYQKGSEIVVAFRGTAQGMDGIADLKLGTGMNSTYFSDGTTFVHEYRANTRVFLCGHSLGGAIAQVVANRGGFYFVTFNSPGVAVLSSRNILTASPTMTAIRTAGMLASVVRHPVQATQDVRAAFDRAHGLNVCLAHDAVSQIGIHYGEVIRIQGTSFKPWKEHGIATMNDVLATHPIGNRRVESL